MKKFIFFILFIGININVFAQINNAMLKYWYYKDRLKYFVVPGTKQGESEIICNRNNFGIDANYHNDPFHKQSSIGQHGVHFGYYLGMLATEYSLLTNNGQDASGTLNELNLALAQFENYMDMNGYWTGQGNAPDGFFVRENVPCDFMDTAASNGESVSGEKHINLLNENLTPSNIWNGTNRFTGLQPGQPGYTDLIYSRICNTTDITKEEMSQDEAIGVLMGLALVKKLCPPLATESHDNACRIISYVQNKLFAHGTWPWTIYNPDGSPVELGASAVLYAAAFEKVADYFNNNCINYTWDPTLNLAWQVQKWFSNPTIWNNSMSAVLAAIGNSWHVGINFKFGCCRAWCPSWLCLHISLAIPATGMGIHNVWNFPGSSAGAAPGNETFYLLLWEVLHNKSTDRLSMDKVAAQISSAPCYGPYNYSNGNHPANDAYGGWSSDYRWRDWIYEQQGDVDEPGNYNGVDYMLFHNLLRLVTYGGTPYLNYIDRVLTGTVSSPVKFIGFNSITSTQTIEPTSPWVIYKAGNYIELKPGFHAMAGSNFHAYIGDISGCDDPTPANTIDTMCCFNHYNPKDTIIVPYYDSLVTIPQTPYNLTPENAEVIDTLPCGNDTLHFNGIADDTTITIYDSLTMHDTTISAGPFSYQWDFGNGQTSNNKTVDVIYSPGTYHCQLILTHVPTGVTDTLRFGFVVPVCDTNTIHGTLAESPACGGAPVEGDTLVLITDGVILPDSICRPAVTNMYGEFYFDSLQIASLNDTLLYAIATKSGFAIDDTAKTIQQWQSESPLALTLKNVNQEWVARYNGADSLNDVTSALDLQGNIYVTGATSSDTTAYDMLTIKYDSSGTRQWTTTYRASNNYKNDNARAITVAASGNVYITGESDTTGVSLLTTLSYTSGGTLRWVRKYQPSTCAQASAKCILQDHAGNIIVGGTSSCSSPSGKKIFTILKYDTNGNLLWSANYTGPATVPVDYLTALAVDDSNNVYASGFSQGVGTNYDMATVKYNSSGTQLWVARYDNADNGNDYAYSNTVDNNGNIIVTGCSHRSSGNDEIAVIKYNPGGTRNWVSVYNSDTHDYALKALCNDSNEVYIGGYTGSTYSSGMLALKYNAGGSLLWQKYSLTSDMFNFRSAALDNADNIYITGTTVINDPKNTDITTQKLNSEGEIQWTVTYNGPAGNVDFPTQIIISANGNVYVSANSIGNSTYYDFTTLKYSQCLSTAENLRTTNPNVSTNIVNTVTENSSILVIPNPNNGNMQVAYEIPENTTGTFEVYNMMGKKLFSYSLFSGKNTFSISRSDLNQGIYFYRATAGNKQIGADKIVIIK